MFLPCAHAGTLPGCASPQAQEALKCLCAAGCCTGQSKVTSWRRRWRQSFAIFLHKLGGLQHLDAQTRLQRVRELVEQPETLSLQVLLRRATLSCALLLPLAAPVQGGNRIG